MSVIFQTLKKLRNAHYEDQQKGLLSKTPGLHGFRKGFISFAVFLLVILGIVAIYGSRIMGNHWTKDTSQGETATHAPRTSGYRAEYMAPKKIRPSKRFSASVAMELPKKENDRSQVLELAYAFPDKRPLDPALTEVGGEAENVSEQRDEPRLQGEPSVDAQKTENARHNRLHRIRVQQCGEITGLVAQVERLLAAGDYTRSKGLIDRLAALKGGDNSYVLKLRSYWHIRQGEFGAAEPLLAMVLEKNQDDLEAGINMAIVEINAKKVPAARNRLIQLKAIYDADTVIPELLRQIEKQR
jgi:hypothetical protein